MVRFFSVLQMLTLVLLTACSPGETQVEMASKVVNLSNFQLIYTPGQLAPETLLELAVSGQDIKSVRGEIIGLDMSMGKIPLFFKQTQQNTFAAQFLLGVCSDPDMFWQVRITVTKHDGTEQVLTDKFQAIYP